MVDLSGSPPATIMVVDDVPYVREHICRMLTPEGYAILEARDAAHALDLCRKHPGPIHLLITDIRMPDVNGLELAAQMRAIRPDLRVLYISGYGREEVAQGEGRKVYEAFLSKPIGARAICEKVRAMLAAD